MHTHNNLSKRKPLNQWVCKLGSGVFSWGLSLIRASGSFPKVRVQFPLGPFSITYAACGKRTVREEGTRLLASQSRAWKAYPCKRVRFPSYVFPQTKSCLSKAVLLPSDRSTNSQRYKAASTRGEGLRGRRRHILRADHHKKTIPALHGCNRVVT